MTPARRQLRAGEVTALALDDVDWRRGEVLVHGKGRRETRLPLPQDVGKALASYLDRGRPAGSSRRIFLRSRAPHSPLAIASTIDVVRRALRRVGVSAGGAHLLRHCADSRIMPTGRVEQLAFKQVTVLRAAYSERLQEGQ